MNKTAIKDFAIWARVQLIEAAKQRAYEYEITDGGENKSDLEAIGGRVLSKTEKEQRSQLIAEINRKGYDQVMEEAAYTWFNRFIALRFMEVNGYLPSKVRVFTDETGAFKPEILKQAMTVDLDGLDRSKVLDLLDKQNNEELYKYLLITQCNALNAGLPYMFEKIANWTELLFPANLLRQDSIIGKLISDIAIEDWDDEVEIIGWFYQYYISEKHEEVVDPLHGKVVNKEDIPAATQLFTTDWVVRYILDNSLGRYWIERHPESKLAEKLTYFVTPKNGVIPAVNENILPEELKVLDPCVGSGHFLAYAFDILLEIYRECGWSDRDAAKSIIENNLYGLDIDDRAAQLACFSVTMKARKYNRRIISSDAKLHILAIQDSTSITDELINYVAMHDASIKNDLNEIRLLFNNAKEYGSIINVPKLDFASLYICVEEIKSVYAENLMEMAWQRETFELLLPLIQQAEILSGKYHIVATNPPYFNKYSARLSNYINEHYADYKGDFFSVFMIRNFNLCVPCGYSGFMTPNVWMFITSYEKTRQYIIGEKCIITLVQMATGAFFKEATVDVCAFVMQNSHPQNKGLYIRLERFKGDMETQRSRTIDAIKQQNCEYFYEADQTSYFCIESNPIVYWASNRLIETFKNSKKLRDIAEAKVGLQTGENNVFLRLWFEVADYKICFTATSSADALKSASKWFPYNKGGAYRKWYGNNDYIVNWFNDGWEIKHFVNSAGQLKSRPQNTSYYFRPSITWSYNTTGLFNARAKPSGFIFDVSGVSLFTSDDIMQKYILGLLCSNVALEITSMLNPTINMQVGDMQRVPVVVDDAQKEHIVSIVKNCITDTKRDWDSYEVSWDFKKHPLI